jgi:hypothetical protein
MYQAQRLYNHQFLKYEKPIPYKPKKPQTNYQNQLYQNLNNTCNSPIQQQIKDPLSNMLSSPEIKLNFDSVNKNNFMRYSNNKMSLEDLRTQASTSSESLLSSNSKLSFNLRGSNESLLMCKNNNNTSPFNLNGYNNYCINEYNNIFNHQRNISMNNPSLNNMNYFSINNNTIQNLTSGNLFSCNNTSNINNNCNLRGSTKIPSSKKLGKNYYNKFNSPKENINNATSENTVILTLKIKISKDEFRVFNLKKYDDLFVSLQKFFDLNKIKQDFVKPIVAKVFATLNKIFWLLNSKVGIYDQEYLNSLYRLWKKNNEKIPIKIQEEINNNSKNNDLSKNNSSNNSFSSTDSNSSKSRKGISASFQDENSLDNSRQDTARSF